VADRVDFSANATVYDRRHGAALSDDSVTRLWLAAGLRAGAAVLDIGAGTGRVAIPFADRGAHVVALEPARGMVKELRAKAGDTEVAVVIGDGGQLPFAAGRFDAVVVARLLYLTPAWSVILSEAQHVLAAGGCLLHEWGNGQAHEEWVQIREEARRLFERAGIESPFHPGARSEVEVHGRLESLGFVRQTELALGPGPSVTLKEFLRRLVEGELSYIWGVPDSVRSECLPLLTRWSEQTFDLDRPMPMPQEIRWSVYRKSAA
jgi:SAM-dependent methyltransferase